MAHDEFSISGSGRLDAALRSLAELSHGKARAAIRSGKVRVNGETIVEIGAQVYAGQILSIHWAAPNPRKLNPHGLELVFRDEHLLVVNKPAGLLSTPTSAEEPSTALAGAKRFCRGGRPPLVVHRLDKETSGLLVFARGQKSAKALRESLDSRAMTRMYRCVTRSAPRRAEGTICSFLVRDAGRGRRGSRPGSLQVFPLESKPNQPRGHGRWSVTRYKTVAHSEGRAALEVWLETGRTHQIRIHLAEIQSAIVGERVYARRQEKIRQALHAARLVVPHPVTAEALQFESPWPDDLRSVQPIGDGWSS